MSVMLRTALIIISALTLWYTARKIRKSQLQIEDSIFWLVFPAALVVLSIFPDIASWAADQLGVQSPVNFIFLGRHFYFDCESIFPFSPPFPNGYQNPDLNAGNRYPGMPGEREKDEKANGIKGKEG